MIVKVTTGFMLTSLIKRACPDLCWLGLDTVATAENIKDEWEAALEEAYPGAWVDVHYELGDGELPEALKTRTVSDILGYKGTAEEMQAELEIASVLDHVNIGDCLTMVL